MSSARQHIEWLSLVPVSGPFLSLPVLEKGFPQGLDTLDTETTGPLRLAYAEWRSSKPAQETAAQYRWVTFVLKDLLGFDGALVEGQGISQTLHVEIPEHGEVLRPTFVLMDPATRAPRLLVQTYPRGQELSTYVTNARWKASPDTRMAEQLHGAGVRLGLVTNGEHWMLVDAPKGETTGYASWYAGLWLEEPITLRAFRSLLGADRFFGEPDKTLEAMLAESASNQQEVTERLGHQVLKAVEVLIQSLDRADQDYGRSLLVGVPEATLYESALTIMMRLVFLFCAEERELIPSKPFPVYEQNYSVSAISRQLRDLADQHGEELLERRLDAWPRLLSAFRAVYGGIHHDDVHIPAYGGNLFNPDRFPFLEGRQPGTTWRNTDASPLPVNNRTVLHLLEALQELEMKAPAGGAKAEKRRLSFRALDIEQIGHVYEGLLDHTAKRATEPYLGLGGSANKEPEIPLAALEAAAAKGLDDLVKLVKEETGRSESAIRKALTAALDPQFEGRLATACQSNQELLARVRPFAGLVRRDSFEYPVVIPKGSVFVTAGTDRRSSGTHYTPRSLTEPIVQYTLEPLVYVGPAEGLPKNEWKLKSAKDLLALNICDMACGSGAFLVQTARYMAERLMEAWDAAKADHPNFPGITPEGEPSTGKADESLIPDDPDERKVYAMRIIAQRCLYGVDKNPLAVEMAKLSLWLLTLAKDKPFEFLDHSIRSGDSLVGIHDIEQLRHYRLKPDPHDAVLFKGPLDAAVDEAIALRLKLEDLPANTIEDVERQEKLLKEANDKIAKLKYAADLLVSAEFWGENAKDKLERSRFAADMSTQFINSDSPEDLVEFEALGRRERRNQPMFHWLLEFPEVLVGRGGFNAFVGNPPFQGGKKITGTLGTNYRDFILGYLAKGQKGHADICAYFFLRSASLLQIGGNAGLVATNTISQGDTREVGLDQLDKEGVKIYRAVPSRPWPGKASLEVAYIWIRNSLDWLGEFSLDETPVAGITSFLRAPGKIEGIPFRLNSNISKSFIGSFTYGMGFILTHDEAKKLTLKDIRNKDVLFPYLNGEDLNTNPDQSASRSVINFSDWPLDRSEVGDNYSGPTAAEYPDCLKILEQTVKPERLSKNEATAKAPWWQFWRIRKELYQSISTFEKVICIASTSRTLAFAVVSSRQVFSHAICIFTLDPISGFALLQSSFHEVWARNYASSMKNDLRYTPSDCFDTFPIPFNFEILATIGKKYLLQREQIGEEFQEGLTKIYHRFHNQNETSSNLNELRRLHVEMDHSVAKTYGWTDIHLNHGFQETKLGKRFTISELARRELLQRLLELNHQRYEDEVKQGLHKKKGALKAKLLTSTNKEVSHSKSGFLFDI